MHLEGRWWNGTWAQRTRRDIWLRTDGTVWRVEARQGSDRRSTFWSHDYPDEGTARAQVAAMMARTGDKWKDLTSLYPD